jgi:hypothetical protein
MSQQLTESKYALGGVIHAWIVLVNQLLLQLRCSVVAACGVYELNCVEPADSLERQRNCEEKEQSNVVVCGIDQMFIRKV